MSLLRPPLPLEDLLSEIDSDSSEASFQPTDISDDSESSTDLTSPEPPRLPESRPRSERRPGSWALADYSDDPDDTDADIQDVSLDYGRSENTKAQGDRIEKRWHKYCRVKAAEAGALPKWNDPAEALRLLKANDVYRFLNYCMKLKSGQDGHRLKRHQKS